MNKNLNHLEWASGTVILWLEAISSLGRRLMTGSCLLVTTFLRFMRLPLSNNTLGNLYQAPAFAGVPSSPGLTLGKTWTVEGVSPFSLSPHFPIPLLTSLRTFTAAELICVVSEAFWCPALILSAMNFSTQATIDLVIGYHPPSAPHPNDPGGTSMPGMGGKLTLLTSLQ